MGKFTSLFMIATLALINGTNCENIILGTVAGKGHSQFGGGSSQQHYSNDNGVVVSYEGYTTYEQKPNGDCVKKMVEVKNGISNVKEFPIDCEEAKKEINRIAEKTSRQIDDKHEKMLKEHYQALEKMQKEIQKMQENFPKFI